MVDLALIGDIGATNARFSLCREVVGGSPELLDTPVILSTQAYTEGEALLRDAAEALQKPKLTGALLAVAGPASHADYVVITNTGLVLQRASLETLLRAPVAFVNDFFAMASGLQFFQRLVQIGGQAPTPDTKALLGPGSGLGMAGLIPVSVGGAEASWQVIASEGGHADLAPGSPLEAELWTILNQAHDHVCWETVLSGPGLRNVYDAMCSLWGITPEALSSEEISAQAVGGANPICHQTLDVFLGLLGTAAGNLALTLNARGGVYLGGGIVPQLVNHIADSPLRRRFEERGELSSLAKNIPLLVICDEQPGLVGASHCLDQLNAGRPGLSGP